MNRCGANSSACPFGEEFHFEDFQFAKEAAEKMLEETETIFPRAPLKEKYDFDWFSEENCSINIDDERTPSSEKVDIRLKDQDGKSLAIVTIRYLSGNRINAIWRETFHNSVKGSSAVLQEILMKTHPGFKFVSHPGEMSPEAITFREKFLAHNPRVQWDLDLAVGSDSGCREDYAEPIDEHKVKELNLSEVWENLGKIKIN